MSPDRCQLVTNYNKIFIYRYGQAISPRIVKLKKLLATYTNKKLSIKRGSCTILNRSLMTTLEFDELAAMFVNIRIGDQKDYITFYFNAEDHSAMFSGKAPVRVQSPTSVDENTTDRSMIEDTTLYPVAIRMSTSANGEHARDEFYLSATSNQVYNSRGIAFGELSEFLISQLGHYIPEAEDELGNTSPGTRFIFSKVRIMHEDLPLILVMGASDPDGIIGALDKGHLNYQFSEKRPTVDKTKIGMIQFADGFLTYDRYPYENSLLMNGFQAIPTKEYNFYDLCSRDAYVEIFDSLCGKRSLADNMKAFYYMMVDPITKEVLRRLNMPTDFMNLLYYCNGVLADNKYQIDSNYENSRIRSNEVVMAYLYHELALAWSNVKNGKTDTFSIPQDIVIKTLLTSKIVDPKSKLNIALELENDRNVKLKGPSGMNEDHSFTIEKRAFHPSMRGVVAANSTPSGEVGINRHMVVNTNIVDARGFIKVNAKDADEYDGTELMSPGELLQPFSAEAADIERTCMSISQSKHLVPVESQSSSPVSFDFERVAPHMSNDYAFRAKKSGTVVEIKDDLMIIKYDDQTFDDIDLSEHPNNNTDGGFYIMNQMVTNLKVGDTFEADQIPARDPKVINNNDFFGDPSANTGTLARIAFESNGSVFEDSGYITDDFAHRFAARITKQKRVVLSRYANITKMAKVGDKVEANDIILAFDDTEDEFSAQLLRSITDQMEDQDEVIATAAPVISKFAGKIVDIDIYYTVPPEDLSPSIRAIVEEYVKVTGKREKTISKYIDTRDSNTILKQSEMSIPDSLGRVAGTKIEDGVIIDFYIEFLDIAGNGDKGSVGALKFTTCNVVPTELAAYTDSNPDRKIDVYIASFGAFKRMVADVEKIGILNKVLVESKRKMKLKYHDAMVAELAKMK